MENALVVKLSTTQRAELVDYYTNKINELQSLIVEYKDLLNQLSEQPGQSPIESQYLEPERKTVKIPNSLDYRKSWSWSAKIRYVLRNHGSCLTSRQIVEKLQELEPELDDKAINNVSGSISSKISKNIVFNRYKPYEGSENYIGLREWFTEDGKLFDFRHEPIEL